ncbi:MAG: VOC family protein [Actinomycetota bacterium]|nr:VOC family protein [Actinomycetota bacterium]
MSLLGFHHVQLAMPEGEEAAAVAFYEGILGIPQVAKPPHLRARGGCWFESETVRIHLGVESDFRPARKAHPALLVHDLATIKRHLVDAGIAPVEDQPLWGFDRIYVNDPFGNRIEVLEATLTSSEKAPADSGRRATGDGRDLL